MGKKILVLGAGAQGSTVAQRMDEDASVSEIICADYDEKAVGELAKLLKKGRGLRVDAGNKGEIVAAANGSHLIVNALPLEFHKNVLDAALVARACYQDFAATDLLADTWAGSLKVLYEDYGQKFADAGLFAIIGTGSAPGLICCATRMALRELDTCDTIYNLVYEGVEAKRFLPFWWSPVTALKDMSDEAWAVIDGDLVRTPAFGLPVEREYDYMGLGRPITLLEHCHDEPLHYWFNRDTYLKGAKNIWFKYNGVGMEFAAPLYRAGLLSRKAEQIGGQSVVPFDVVLAHIPPAPKYRAEVEEIIEEGLVADTGCMVVEAIGQKGGKAVRSEVHVFAPGLRDSFARSGLTAEMYLTGQGGALFTKMICEDRFGQRGLISSDMLSEPQIDYYFECAAGLGITLEKKVAEL